MSVTKILTHLNPSLFANTPWEGLLHLGSGYWSSEITERCLNPTPPPCPSCAGLAPHTAVCWVGGYDLFPWWWWWNLGTVLYSAHHGCSHHYLSLLCICFESSQVLSTCVLLDSHCAECSQPWCHAIRHCLCAIYVTRARSERSPFAQQACFLSTTISSPLLLPTEINWIN